MSFARVGRRFLAAALAASCAALAGGARAAELYWCVADTGAKQPFRWHDLPATKLGLGYPQVSFPGSFETALQASVGAWNRGPAAFRFALAPDETVALANGESEIWFEAGVGAFAKTSLVWSCDPKSGLGALKEADIRFDAGVPFAASHDKGGLHAYGGPDRHFAAYAVHELGHALGLYHTSSTYTVMLEAPEGHVHANGPFVHAHPGEDAAAGAVELYDVGVAQEDLGVVHWRLRWGAAVRTGLLQDTGNELSRLPGAGKEPVFQVTAGQDVEAPFTFENTGTSSFSAVKVGYFVSDDDLVTTWDRKIDEEPIDFVRDTVETRSRKLKLPDDLEPGATYFLGAIVDVDDAVDEVNETNNATYVEIRVTQPKK